MKKLVIALCVLLVVFGCVVFATNTNPNASIYLDRKFPCEASLLISDWEIDTAANSFSFNVEVLYNENRKFQDDTLIVYLPLNGDITLVEENGFNFKFEVTLSEEYDIATNGFPLSKLEVDLASIAKIKNEND